MLQGGINPEQVSFQHFVFVRFGVRRSWKRATLKKIYGTGEKSLPILVGRKFDFAARRDGCDCWAVGSGQKYFVTSAGRARHANKRYSILRFEST